MDTKIKTSEENWLERAVKCYTRKTGFTFVDDAGIGLDENDLKSAVHCMKGALSKSLTAWKSIAGVLAGIGISSLGIYIIRLAILDPEPTTKLGLLITGGLVLAFTGSLGILFSLGVTFNVSASSAFGSFEVHPI